LRGDGLSTTGRESNPDSFFFWFVGFGHGHVNGWKSKSVRNLGICHRQLTLEPEKANPLRVIVGSSAAGDSGSYTIVYAALSQQIVASTAANPAVGELADWRRFGKQNARVNIRRVGFCSGDEGLID